MSTGEDIFVTSGGVVKHLRNLHQRSPAFLAAGTNVPEDSFSTDGGWGAWGGTGGVAQAVMPERIRLLTRWPLALCHAARALTGHVSWCRSEAWGWEPRFSRTLVGTLNPLTRAPVSPSLPRARVRPSRGGRGGLERSRPANFPSGWLSRVSRLL